MRRDVLLSHVWVGGMVYVDPDDVETVAQYRALDCDRCGVRYPADTMCEGADGDE